MAFEIPENLHPDLMGLAWMLGRWQGNGHGTWPGTGDFEFGQQIDVTANAGPYLHYISQTWTMDDEGQPDQPLSIETGFWRGNGKGGAELVMANPEGWAEIWLGKIDGAKVELVTDLVARTQTAALSYTAGQRLYGNVDGELLWTFDRATADVELQPYMWAKLKRV